MRHLYVFRLLWVLTALYVLAGLLFALRPA